MQYFLDKSTGKVFAFQDDVVAIPGGSGYTFKTVAGVPLSTIPATLVPTTAPTTTPPATPPKR